MSFFKSLVKGTFDIVHRDISTGIKHITTNDATTATHTTIPKDFNECAGEELLNRHQENWQEIHVALQENAKRAQTVDVTVCALHDRVEREYTSLNRFAAELSNITELTAQLGKVVEQINGLTDPLSDTENMLVTLEDVCEQQDLKMNELGHRNRLALYYQTKEMEVERAKVQLSKQHAKNVQKFESRLQRNMKEKQEAFEATYREEIHKYKTTGQTQLKPTVDPAHLRPSLSDIELPKDETGLEAFLQSDEPAMPPQRDGISLGILSTEARTTETVPETNDDRTSEVSDFNSEVAEVAAEVTEDVATPLADDATIQESSTVNTTSNPDQVVENEVTKQQQSDEVTTSQDDTEVGTVITTGDSKS